MDERAVAPVVAAMLLLAALVMFLSVYNAIVVPSFKEQAEVEHLYAVEESFLAFGSDMTTAAALKQDLHLSKRIPLGGGETIFDPVRSGGSLRVSEDPGGPLASVTVDGTPYFCNLTNFSYTPISNFWRDQGYIWQYGYTNVTGAGGLQTPLDYADMDKVREAAERSGFAGSLIEIEHDGRYDNNDNYNCTDVRIWVVTFEPDKKHYFASGNGVGTLSLNAAVEDIRITPSPNTIEIAVNTGLPVPLNTSLWAKCNETFHAMNETYANVENCTFSPKEDPVTLTFTDSEHVPERVTLRLVRVVVSAR
ncbi:MAG: hypothetical protein HQQ74_05320 [Methanoculleus bourgensis]|uniref:Archaeal Type IV pilin N-terminal domain-containing protein n=1 Tax=Methanoculleus bourgensis TaxID=83986 RepID=A0A8T7H658_9EURY|nr:hypothetical protein [Methanoculleus bourgensis]